MPASLSAVVTGYSTFSPFQARLVTGLASSLGVPVADVQVSAMRAGSIIADLCVRQSMESEVDLCAGLKEAVGNPDSGLFQAMPGLVVKALSDPYVEVVVMSQSDGLLKKWLRECLPPGGGGAHGAGPGVLCTSAVVCGVGEGVCGVAVPLQAHGKVEGSPDGPLSVSYVVDVQEPPTPSGGASSVNAKTARFSTVKTAHAKCTLTTRACASMICV